MRQNSLDSTVLQTLKAIGQELRTQKFILRGTIKRKKEFEKQEVETRIKIKNLIHKIEWEFSRSSKIQEEKDNY